MHTGSDQRKPAWYWIDNAVLKEYGPQIGPTGIAIYNVLALHANGNREAWPSNARMAEMLGITVPTVRSAIQRLEESGLITVLRRQKDGVNLSNHYTLNNLGGSKNSLLLVKNLDQWQEKKEGGSKENLPRTRINEQDSEKNFDDDDKGQAPDPKLPQEMRDQEWGAAIRLFQRECGWLGGGGPTFNEMQDVFDDLREKGLTVWWDQAVKVAVDQNARSWAYVRSVLRNALSDNKPPGALPPKGAKKQNGAYQRSTTARPTNGTAKGNGYDDGLGNLSQAERDKLSEQLRAARQAPRLPGV